MLPIWKVSNIYSSQHNHFFIKEYIMENSLFVVKMSSEFIRNVQPNTLCVMYPLDGNLGYYTKVKYLGEIAYTTTLGASSVFHIKDFGRLGSKCEHSFTLSSFFTDERVVVYPQNYNREYYTLGNVISRIR